MTKKHSTKRALIASILVLCLCMTSFIGTTFAWFTDSVTSNGNIIKSGTLDVEMYWADGKGAVDGASWADASKGPIFKNELWEPGYTEARHIKIANEGTLALKYQLAIIPRGEVSELADVIDVYYVEGGKQISGRADLSTLTPIGTLAELINNGIQQGSLKAGANFVATIVLKMQESAGNEYQDLAIGTNFAIQLLATQMIVEDDSFGNDYDEDAWVDGMLAYNASDLQAAINAGESEIKLMNDIQLDETIVIPAPAVATYSARNAVEIDLNGKTVSGYMHKNVGAIISNEGSLILKNGVVSSLGNNGGSALVNKGTAVLENVTLNGAPNADGSWPSYTLNNTGVLTATNVKFTSFHGSVSSYNAGAIVTLNNCEIDMKGIPGFTNHGIYTYSNGKVVINGGTYVNHAADQSSTGGSVINGAVTVNGGSFSGRVETYSGTPVIQGGTFTVDVKKYVPDGFKMVENGGKYVVVSDDVANVVSTPAELASAIAAGGKVFIAADIDVNNAWTSVVPANGLIILGNGYTITNLNKPLLAGKGGPVVTVKELTIADSNVGIAANENGLGSGAFVAYADHSGKLVFEDCHLLNSTVAGNERTAAFTGYSYAEITIKNCSVEDCTFAAVGSTAALVGHANNLTVIENTSVINTKVTATEDRTGKTALAGSLIGTIASDITLTNVTAIGNTVSNNGATPFSAEIGRIASGSLTIDGSAVATTSNELVSAIYAAKDGDTIILAPGDYALRFTNNTAFNVDNLNFVGVGEVNLSVSSSEAWYGRVQGSNVTFENINFASAVGATGKATYNDCTFASWTICASSNKEETYFNNCVINGCFNTSTDFSSGNVFVKDSKIAKAEYSGSMTVNFENCEIDEVIIWNSNTNFTNCEIAKMDLSNVTTAVIIIDGVTVNE